MTAKGQNEGAKQVSFLSYDLVGTSGAGQDDVLARKPVALTFSTPEKADEFQDEVERLGAVVERRIRCR